MGTWLNDDGLYRKFGTDSAGGGGAGEYRLDGHEHCIQIHVVCDELTETETILDDNTWIPKGALITHVVLDGTEAAATGVAVDIGLIKTDRTTEYNYDGLLQAMTTAKIVVGAHLDLALADVGAASSGATVGTVMTENAYISGSRTTSTAFTAGEFDLSIYYIVP